MGGGGNGGGCGVFLGGGEWGKCGSLSPKRGPPPMGGGVRGLMPRSRVTNAPRTNAQGDVWWGGGGGDFKVYPRNGPPCVLREKLLSSKWAIREGKLSWN